MMASIKQIQRQNIVLKEPSDIKLWECSEQEAKNLTFYPIIAAAYIINNDEVHEIDDWLHHKQHIKGLRLNGFPIGNVWQKFETS